MKQKIKILLADDHAIVRMGLASLLGTQDGFEIVGDAEVAGLVASIAFDIREGGRGKTAAWREELVAKSVARSYAGASKKLTRDAAVALVEELGRCRMPYVDPRGRRVMVFTSNRELERKFRGG